MPLKTAGLAAAAAASSLRRANLQLFSTAAPTRASSSSLLYSTTITGRTQSQTKGPPPTAHFMTEYLISNCGFSPSDAAKHSDCLSHLTTTSKPDAVLRFLRGLGLDPAALRSVISCRPGVLRANVTKTLEPKLASLRAASFSDTEISMLVAASPAFLGRNFLPNLQLLGAYLPSKADLLKALCRDPTLLSSKLTDTLVPNAALLRSYGVAERDVGHALIALPRLLTRKADSFKELVERVDGLGFPRGGSTFLPALNALNQLSKETFRSKVDTMTSSWWSQAEFNAAFLKAPNFLCCSDEALDAKMRFLVEEAGLEPRDIAERPLFLTFSLENRLVPRHRAHQILKAKRLSGSKSHLFSIVNMGQKRFLEHYVLPHWDRVPALREIYPAACPENAYSGVVIAAQPVDSFGTESLVDSI